MKVDSDYSVIKKYSTTRLHIHPTHRHILTVFCLIIPCIGSTMEVNISHRSRQEILSTADLAQPDLFRNAQNELVQLMKMVGSLPEKFKILTAFVLSSILLLSLSKKLL